MRAEGGQRALAAAGDRIYRRCAFTVQRHRVGGQLAVAVDDGVAAAESEDAAPMYAVELRRLGLFVLNWC